MFDAFLPALGLLQTAAETAEASGLRETFRLLDLPELWVVVLLILPAVALVSWLAYRSEPSLSSGARTTLSLLRFCALTLLVLVLFRPVLVERREDVQPAEVLVLVDDSASMRRMDAYGGDPAQRKALEQLVPGALAETTRTELARVAALETLLPGLESRGYVPRLFAFDDELRPLSAQGSAAEPAAGAGPTSEQGSAGAARAIRLEGRGVSTQIGDSLGSVLAAHRGRHVTDVVLLTDGRQNAGAPAQIAARTAAASGIPVHTIVIGDTRPERNALVELVEAPSSTLEGDEVTIVVRVLGRGTPEGTLARVLLEELEPGSGATEASESWRVLGEDSVELSEDGERVTLIAEAGPPDRRTGDRRFRVTLPPIDGETLLDDNRLEVNVHVTPEKVRVLYVEGYPRWEYRRLALDMLKRSDENIEFQAFLLSATPDFVQESTPGTPALTAVPTDRRALLDNYDVVILGDVNPWAVSPDPARSEEFMRSLVEFVERGGGLLLIAGEYDNPRAFVSTPLEDVFPVVLDAAEMSGPPMDTTREVRPRLEDPANPHEVVRLVPDQETNRRLWESETDGLRGFFWFMPTSRAKPGSQTLLVHPTKTNQSGPYPLLVAGYYPSGRTLFQAIDSTWMWHYLYGHRYYDRYWRNAIRWLALGRMKSGDRRYRLELARDSVNLGERATVEARVLDEDFRPSEDPAQPVRWSAPDGRPEQLDLTAVPGRKGLFRGSIAAERPGLHRVWIEQAGQRLVSAEYEVVLPSLENQDPSPDPTLLAEISAISRGRALDLVRIEQVFEEFPGDEERREPVSSRLDDIWDTWATLLAVLAVLSAEWILRKRLELV